MSCIVLKNTLFYSIFDTLLTTKKVQQIVQHVAYVSDIYNRTQNEQSIYECSTIK